MFFLERFSLKKYLMVSFGFFLGGCLFFDSSTETNEKTRCGPGVILENAHRFDCGYVCHGQVDCAVEDGRFNCEEGICVEFCDVGCSAQQDCKRCNGQTCDSDSGCESDFCSPINICEKRMAETCLNEKKDGDEMGIDCGGSCAACENETCNSNQDCALPLVCNDSTCQICDGCGKNHPCGLCKIGEGCENESANCESDNCPVALNVCTPMHCKNNVKDDDEDGVNCGGSCLFLCPGEACSPSPPPSQNLCFSEVCETGDSADLSCIARSCKELLDTGRSLIHPVGAGVQIDAYCGDDGWTLLGLISASSGEWSHSGEFWTTVAPDQSAGMVGNYFGQTFAYSELRTNQIKLCYIDETRCFEFNHGQDRTLLSFFTEDTTFSSGLMDTDGGFLLAFGFEVIIPPEEDNKIKCYEWGISLQNGEGRIGLVGDVSPCEDFASSVDKLNDLAMGVGLKTVANKNVGGHARYVQKIGSSEVAPNNSSLGSWLIFGK